jgi:hypothetical protein
MAPLTEHQAFAHHEHGWILWAPVHVDHDRLSAVGRASVFSRPPHYDVQAASAVLVDLRAQCPADLVVADIPDAQL